MNNSDNPIAPTNKIKVSLGPFVGDITSSGIKIWLNVEGVETDLAVFVTLTLLARAPVSEAAKGINKNEVVIREVEHPSVVQMGVIQCRADQAYTGWTTFSHLEANAKYSYRLWLDEQQTSELDLNGLKSEDLYFWTLPEDGYGRQLDFLLMSCHNPGTKEDDGFKGFAVWNQIPSIIDVDQNANVRFAILCGDQIYADDVETQVLNEPDPAKRRKLYLDIYRRFWSSIEYRKVLCRLPAVLMWDDHDITDGWGSREDSFVDSDSAVFKPEWQRLFASGREMFAVMQASRNPQPLSPNFENGFDTCFRIGKAGFVLADLRSNRNVREKRVWSQAQVDAIRAWVDANKHEMHTLFFVSSVVFSHGAPKLESYLLRIWFRVLDIARFVARTRVLKKVVRWFDRTFGDLRDDINDSWGAEVNAAEADRVLDFLFEIENPPDGNHSLNVIILSGDIHTPGYSTIYSAAEGLKKAVIPHIVATPVSYEPFSWIGEAVFRHLTKVVALGKKGMYTSQVSHHFCYRNVVVVSLRNYEADESHLKVKYYLEGFPEPQVMLFDLIHGARREAIKWPDPPPRKGLSARLWERFGGNPEQIEPVPIPGLDLPEPQPPVN